MKGVYYRWKKPEGTSDCSSRQIGFIAQSVKESVPELVTANDKGYLALAYDRIPALLVEAMKEQQQIIERQKRDIASLRSSHVTLQQRMRALEGRFERMFISLSGSDKKSTLSSALDAGGNRQAAIQ